MSLDTVHSAVVKHQSMGMRRNTLLKISSLPPELLPKIFKYLDIHDRKNVRLTCCLWNDVCNLQEIIKYEKFVFHLGKEGCDLPGLGAHIEECKTLRSCWEFQGLALYRLPSTVWANCGDRVQSLFIHDCVVDDGTISDIIIHCSNLKTFRLQSAFDLDYLVVDMDLENFSSPENYVYKPPMSPPAIPFDFDFDRIFCTEGAIDELIALNIERRNLTTLVLFTPEILSTRKLRKLFQIFPCIQTFGHGLLTFEFRDAGYEVENTTKTEWVFPPTMALFISNVEDDILNSLKRSNSKLKVFSTILDFDKTPYDLFLDLCSEQKELEKLALDMRSSWRDGENMLFSILRSLPKLKELEFQIWGDTSEFWYSPEKLNEFFALTSKMESMSLCLGFEDVNEEYFDVPVVASSPLAEYSALRSLFISVGNLSFIYEILRRCRTSLQNLSVLKVNDRILQLLLKDHTELKILYIDLCDLYKPNEDGSESERRKYPFEKLRNLEYLYIIDIDPYTLRNNMSDFIFPKLKHFEFVADSSSDDTVQNFHTMLRVVCKGAPYLETLRVKNSVHKSIDFVNLFGNVQMKFLRYIIIHSLAKSSLPDKDFGSIDAVFNACPSLCLINFVYNSHSSYSYDRHSKEVKPHVLFNRFDPISYKNILSP